MQVTNPTVSFTRPNDTLAYASGDLVANSTTPGSVTPMSLSMGNSFPMGQVRITRLRLVKSGTVATSATFRVHLYSTSPTVTNGDNGAWLTTGAAGYLGNIDAAAMFALSDGCATFGSAAAGSEILARFSGTTVFALLEARAAYTPVANEVFTLTIECLDAY